MSVEVAPRSDIDAAEAGRRLVLVNEAVDQGGTEQVLEELIGLYPLAPVVCMQFDALLPEGSSTPRWSQGAQLVHGGKRKRHLLTPRYAGRMARAYIEPTDLVVALVAGGWSLGVTLPRGARMLAYVAGVPRAIYRADAGYIGDYPLVTRPAVRAASPLLRRYHRRLLARADRIIANSGASAADLSRLTPRPIDVIHPPVRTDFFTPDPGARRKHFIAVGRLVRAKRFDRVLRAFEHLPGERLVVVGDGPHARPLRQEAPPNVRFTGRASDAELRALYRESHALVCASEEEFGIVLAEAQACGVPVIAPRAGGPLDIVGDPATGVLLDSVDTLGLLAAVSAIRRARPDPEACRRSALRFSRERFRAGIDRAVAEELRASPRRDVA